MEDIFEEKICSICKVTKTENCKKSIIQSMNNGVKSIRCLGYIKNPNKIVPYENPILVTAKRDYVNNIER